MMTEPMQTQSPVYVEYRCQKCWNSNIASSEDVGNEIACPYCRQSNTVPEATVERVERALQLLERQPQLLGTSPQENPKAIHFDRELSDQEMYAIARRSTKVPLSERNFSGHSNASLWQRAIAFFIDQILFAGSILLGFCAVRWASTHGFAVENPFETIRRDQSIQAATWILIGIIPVLVSVLQWVLIATSGQSLGKKLMFIRIVTDQGSVPGFLCGVVMRCWVPGILCMIPIVGNYWYVLDTICYFFGGRKFAHDYIASTRVVSLFN